MRTIVPKNAVSIPTHAKRVFKGIIYDVYQWEQKMFDGSTETYEMLDRPDSVAVVVVDEDKVLIQKQQQANTHEFYSLPGGRNDVEGETEIEAAKRELLEETGLVCANWKMIEVFQPTTHADRFVYIFVASEVSKRGEQKLDAGEKITNTWIGYKELMTLHKAGSIDSFGTSAFNNIDSVSDLLTLPEYKN